MRKRNLFNCTATFHTFRGRVDLELIIVFKLLFSICRNTLLKYVASCLAPNQSKKLQSFSGFEIP